MKEEYLENVWENNPQYIRRFYDNHPKYEKLCNEVKYILSMELDKANLDIAQITARAKILKSFCEKISRKSYENPFDGITDFAGARVVFLYSSDREQIESIIEREFEVIERVDKVSSEEADRFGYGALHYLIKMKKNHSGARYDDLKNLICEVQVRTILQDAWAIVAHHLSYKQESDVPKELRRKLNALSGLFETADDQFENIRLARSSYQEKVKKSIDKEKDISLNEKINLDNLGAYLKWKFPDRENDDLESIADLFGELKIVGYNKLYEIDNIVDKSSRAVKAYEEKYPPDDMETGQPCKYTPVGFIRAALHYLEEKFRKHQGLEDPFIKQRNEFTDLIE